jgi:hypothetical protein
VRPVTPEPEQMVRVVEQEVHSSRAEATEGALTATEEGPGSGGVYTKVMGKATVCGISVRRQVLRAASSTSSSRVHLADEQEPRRQERECRRRR